LLFTVFSLFGQFFQVNTRQIPYRVLHIYLVFTGAFSWVFTCEFTQVNTRSLFTRRF